MRGYEAGEAERRAALVGSHIQEEAEQRLLNVREQAAEIRKSLLARLMGTDSAEDQLQYGDGYRPSADDEDDEDDE